MAKLKCRTAYNAREEAFPGVVCVGDSMTQQHFKDECDVNKIVERYVKTGILEHTAEQPPHFGDVSDVPTDLFSAYEAVDRAEAAFMDLPSGVRKSLDNDPARLSEWLLDPANRNDAIRYGLIVQPESTIVEPKEGSVSSSKPVESPENQG